MPKKKACQNFAFPLINGQGDTRMTVQSHITHEPFEFWRGVFCGNNAL